MFSTTTAKKKQEESIVDKIYRMAYLLLGNEHDAWDLTQEVFLELEKGRKKWEQAQSPMAWAIGVFRNQSKKFFRIKSKHVGVLSEEHLGHEITHEMDVADSTVLKEKLACTFHAIQTLNKDMAEALLLFSLEKIPMKEIAKLQEVPEGTVKWRIFEARRRIYEQVER